MTQQLLRCQYVVVMFHLYHTKSQFINVNKDGALI